MKALALLDYGQATDLQLMNGPPPNMTRGHVLIKVRASAINPADLKTMSGEVKFLHAQKFPLVPGYDFSGEISQVADDVLDWSVGQSVFGFLPYSRRNTQGSFAQFICVPADSIALIPQNLNYIEAASLATTASTALQGLLDKGRLASGEHVLINGAAGGVGVYAVQIARQLGAKVLATCRPQHHNFVRSLGADQVFDYRQIPWDDLKVHILFDVAAKLKPTEHRQNLYPGGRYVTLLPSANLFWDMITAPFYRQKARVLIVKSKRSDLQQIANWLTAGALRPVVAGSYSLPAQANEAFNHFKQGGVQGKIGLSVDF